MPSPVATRTLKLQTPPRPADTAKQAALKPERSSKFETELERAKPKQSAEVDRPARSQRKHRAKPASRKNGESTEQSAEQANSQSAGGARKTKRPEAAERDDSPVATGAPQGAVEVAEQDNATSGHAPEAASTAAVVPQIAIAATTDAKPQVTIIEEPRSETSSGKQSVAGIKASVQQQNENPLANADDGPAQSGGDPDAPAQPQEASASSTSMVPKTAKLDSAVAGETTMLESEVAGDATAKAPVKRPANAVEQAVSNVAAVANVQVELTDQSSTSTSTPSSAHRAAADALELVLPALGQKPDNAPQVSPRAAAQQAPAPQQPSTPEADFTAQNHPKIINSIRGELLPGGGTMHIKLDPPELGALQINIRMHDGAVTASFQTSSDDATRLLSHSLSQLKHVLESQGVSVDKLQVQQAPRDQQQSFDDAQRQQQRYEGSSAQQEQQRREMMRRMWRRLANGSDPLDMVA